MEKSEILADVTHKNTQAFEQALKEVTRIVFEQKMEIEGLKFYLSEVSTRINNLERELNLYRASSFGNGASVR